MLFEIDKTIFPSKNQGQSMSTKNLKTKKNIKSNILYQKNQTKTSIHIKKVQKNTHSLPVPA